ncbi:MAG TPA: hypothetical protein VIV40_44655 [Kofleriaceae bacterium]
MRLVIVVFVLAGCGEVRQVHRWPNHRRDKDEQITALAAKTKTLETRIDNLEEALSVMRQQLMQQQEPLKQQQQPQPAAAALPSPSP